MTDFEKYQASAEARRSTHGDHLDRLTGYFLAETNRMRDKHEAPRPDREQQAPKAENEPRPRARNGSVDGTGQTGSAESVVREGEVMTKPIVVGIDGSDSAQQAVRWAAREATARKAPLRLVHACIVVSAYTPVSLPKSVSDVLADQGREWLREASRIANEVAPDLEVSRILERQDPATALIEESATAQLVVLGSRGLGGFTGLLVGSVATKVAQRGACPVVVVRGEETNRTGKPVVVGVDGSPASEAAIAFAYDEAARLRAPLVAVHAWSDVVPAATFAIVPYAVDWQEIQTEELELLCERLAGWQEKYPDVHVHGVVVQDRPAHSLLEQAREAQLVVVGSRGRGGLSGLLLGSTSQALLHHAPCPVAVVRPD